MLKKAALFSKLLVAGSVETLPTPKQMMFSIHPEVALKIISSLLASLERLRSIQ